MGAVRRLYLLGLLVIAFVAIGLPALMGDVAVGAILGACAGGGLGFELGRLWCKLTPHIQRGPAWPPNTPAAGHEAGHSQREAELAGRRADLWPSPSARPVGRYPRRD
jgi:hypothetical protein